MNKDFSEVVVDLRKFINTWQHPSGGELSIDLADIPANEAWVMVQDAADCLGVRVGIKLRNIND
jgi:hypothetical protein